MKQKCYVRRIAGEILKQLMKDYFLEHGNFLFPFHLNNTFLELDLNEVCIFNPVR